MNVYVFLSTFSSRPTSLQQTNKVDFDRASSKVIKYVFNATDLLEFRKLNSSVFRV
jgi:hypothetical protein